MAIDAYVGKPGHGKSYGVVEHVIIPSLKQGRHVVTNIPLNLDALLMDFGGTAEQLPGDWFEREDLADLVPPGAVLVLDELWRRWPKGQKANIAPLKDKALLAEHRHRVDAKGRSMRVVMVTQDLDQLAAWACTLIETTYRMVKLSKRVYRVDVYRGAAKGERPPKTMRTRQTAGRFKPAIYPYYQSATHSETGEVGDESSADGRGSFLRSWGFWSLVIFASFAAVFGVIGVSNFFTTPLVPTSPQRPGAAAELQRYAPVAPQSVTAPAQRAAAQVYGTSPADLLPSALWRIGGYVHAGKGQAATTWDSVDGYGDSADNQVSKTSRVILVSDGGRTRLVPFEQCRFFPGTPDLYCDIDGERVSQWSGRGAVSTVLDNTAPVNDSGRQRSATPAVDDGASSGTRFTHIPDTVYASRPWR